MAYPQIVLAEDHAAMAGQLAALLQPDYDIALVTSGQELLDYVEVAAPDVILSDIAMPGISGITAARTILAQNAFARIVFVTVQDEPSVIRAALAEGARGYVLKCDAGEELPTAVRTVLDGGRYVSTSARAVLDRLTKPSKAS